MSSPPTRCAAEKKTRRRRVMYNWLLRVAAQSARSLPLVHCVLECLASRKLDRLRGRNLDGLASLRVAAGARCALSRAEAAEADQLNCVTFRYSLLDHFEQRVQRF